MCRWNAYVGEPLLIDELLYRPPNCHPFRHGRWLFVHIGLISRFDLPRRDLLLEVAYGIR